MRKKLKTLSKNTVNLIYTSAKIEVQYIIFAKSWDSNWSRINARGRGSSKKNKYNLSSKT